MSGQIGRPHDVWWTEDSVTGSWLKKYNPTNYSLLWGFPMPLRCALFKIFIESVAWPLDLPVVHIDGVNIKREVNFTWTRTQASPWDDFSWLFVSVRIWKIPSIDRYWKREICIADRRWEPAGEVVQSDLAIFSGHSKVDNGHFRASFVFIGSRAPFTRYWE